MTDRWQDYFRAQGVDERRWLQSAVMHWTFHETLYGMMSRYCSPPARVLDVGCGPGFSDLYLHSAGYDVTGVDNDEAIVSLARDFSARLSIAPRFEQADASDLSVYHGQFDLVYSCGVLEHFDRDITVRLLEEQARCAPRVLIQIPTKYTAYAAPITDERIYTIQQLEQMVRDAGLHVTSAFGYGELAVTPAQVWLRRLLPRAGWRVLQNRGYGYSIAVLGTRRA
jgi:SAM-dependent methyltransferase